QERLEREYNLTLITTAPTVSYRVHLNNGKTIEVDNPAHYPSVQQIAGIDEPVILATIYTPEEYVGPILKLCEDKRGVQRDLQYLTVGRVVIKYELPFNEVVLDFYDRLKSITRGYASLEYEFIERKPADLVKLDILINGEAVDSLSQIVHRDKAFYRGRALCSKMKELIPRQLFEVVIQAAIGAKIVSRSRVAPLRKDVTAKCYGGDISRKRKLLEKQKEGKRRMKRVGHVELPQEAFLAILKVEDTGR
ncbi:MAG: elongation factor 4, partial [Myxococcales bacterium]|nr:elongation factor 4 [Myxococcales bacterium]